jgi:hypothetical protein
MDERISMLHGMEATMRKLLASLALGISLCALSAGPAVAERPEKAPIYGPKFLNLSCTPAEQELPPETFGFLRLRTPHSPTTLRGAVHLKHVRPNTTYNVVAVQGSGGGTCPSSSVGAITTNKKGNGRLGFTVLREQHPPAGRFFVSISGPDEELFGSSSVGI